MTVVAEGVETFEELAYLQAATKIRYAQGYYFSRPIFLEELRPAIPLASEARPVSQAARRRKTARPMRAASAIAAEAVQHRVPATGVAGRIQSLRATVPAPSRPVFLRVKRRG